MLQLRRGLITEGWFARCRNTNYLGEILLCVTPIPSPPALLNLSHR